MGYFGNYILNNSRTDIINGIKDSFGEDSFVLDYSFDKQSYYGSNGDKVHVAYLAVESKTGGTISGGVILYSLEKYWGQYELITKYIPENYGPFYFNCPKRIIKKLSPTDDTNALEWRKKCLNR